MRKRRQVKVDLTREREELLLLLAEATDSRSTNGPAKGEISIGAMIRRICEGQIQLVYQGSRVKVPAKYYFSINNEEA